MVVVSVDLLERFAHQRPHPDANVGRQAVHEAETGNHFELVDVELHWMDGAIESYY